MKWETTISKALDQVIHGTWDAIILELYFNGDPWGTRIIDYLGALENPPPIVVLTARPDLKSAAAAIASPVIGYFSKPADLNQLWLLLESKISAAKRRGLLQKEQGKLRQALANLRVETAIDQDQMRVLQAFLDASALERVGQDDHIRTLVETLCALDHAIARRRDGDLDQLRSHLTSKLDALKRELHHDLVEQTGIKPATSSLRTTRSIN